MKPNLEAIGFLVEESCAEISEHQIGSAESWLIGKDPDAGRDWGQEKEGTTEDEMAGWHHRLDVHVSE